MSRATFNHDKRGRPCFVYRPHREGRSFTIAYRDQKRRTAEHLGGIGRELCLATIQYDVMGAGVDTRNLVHREWKLNTIDLDFYLPVSDPVRVLAWASSSETIGKLSELYYPHFCINPHVINISAHRTVKAVYDDTSDVLLADIEDAQPESGSVSHSLRLRMSEVMHCTPAELR